MLEKQKRLRELENKFEDALSKMDWEKITRVMYFLDWKWVTSKGDVKIPDQFEMEKLCRYLFSEVKRHLEESWDIYWDESEEERNISIVSSGGFTVAYYPNMNSNITIQFVVDYHES